MELDGYREIKNVVESRLFRYNKQKLQVIIKDLYFLHTINDVAIVDKYKQVFQRQNAKVLLLSVCRLGQSTNNICLTVSESLQDSQVGWSSPLVRQTKLATCSYLILQCFCVYKLHLYNC